MTNMVNRIKNTSIFQPSKNIVACRIEGAIILLPVISGIARADRELYLLNNTGQAIWEKINGRCTFENVLSELISEFQVDPGVLEDDVRDFCLEMEKNGFLSRGKQSDAPETID